ncbi:hypothetical protein AMECASPLE_027763 [Ameca splendens]|uniref:Uncharacterized protein n=1 Tax=Ameca splendens TaxID=208324 RepID=A0ABV0XUA8_9TELE
MILARLPAFPSPSCQQSAHLLHLCAAGLQCNHSHAIHLCGSSYIQPLAGRWCQIFENFHNVSSLGFRLFLPLDLCLCPVLGSVCLSLPASPPCPVSALSPVKRPVAAHPAPASASTSRLVILDQLPIRHQSVGRPDTDILGRFRINHLPTEEPLPGPRSHTKSKK